MPVNPALEIPRRRFTPLRNDRVQRFTVGDRVIIAHGSSVTSLSKPVSFEVMDVKADPHPPAFGHCVGRSARYQLQNQAGWRYDWELEPAPAEPEKISRWTWAFVFVWIFIAYHTIKFLFFV